jgi:high-affinity iron transporter
MKQEIAISISVNPRERCIWRFYALTRNSQGAHQREAGQKRNSPLKNDNPPTALSAEYGNVRYVTSSAVRPPHVPSPPAPRLSVIVRLLVLFAALSVLAMMIWQGIAVGGAPDPTSAHTSPAVAALDIAVLVFREGLECILVIAAITASMTGSRRACRRPVAWGAGGAFIATLITWMIAVRIINSLADNVSALNLQAATGLLAVVVLLVIMNWFFHKIYWGGWIRAHNRRRKSLFDSRTNAEASERRMIWGLILLGFTSLYREGFEVVLFLQTYYLRLGGGVVLKGTLLGLILSGFVAVLTFVLQQRLPYRRMLVTTGILLGGVLLVMVGEQAQEMQLAHWISTTPVPGLTNVIPDWVGLWFAVFPTYETLAAQLLAAAVVIGSYYAARRVRCTAEPADEERATPSTTLAAAEQLEVAHR